VLYIPVKNLIIIGELHQDLVYDTDFFNLLIEKAAYHIQNFIKYNPDDINKLILKKIIKRAILEIPKKNNANCTLKRGGNGNNTAEYCAGFGIPTKLISVIGKESDWIINELNSLGIDTSSIFKKNLLTPISTILKSDITTKMFIAKNLKVKMNFEGLKFEENIFKDAKVIYITPITGKFKYLLNLSTKYNMISSLNIEAQKINNYEQLNELIEWKVDLLFINSSDANLILNKNLPLNEVDKSFDKFAEIRVYTAGKEGSYIFTDNMHLSYPSIQLDNIMDRTGAGDCYAAGFLVEDKTNLVQLYQKHNLETFKELLTNCMEFATYTALYKISTQLVPTKKQIEEFKKQFRSS
jgi:sugar/nucleoside kinase (ribokinase family)